MQIQQCLKPLSGSVCGFTHAHADFFFNSIRRYSNRNRNNLTRKCPLFGSSRLSASTTHLHFPHTSYGFRAKFDWGDSVKELPDQGCSFILPLQRLWLRKRSHSITQHSLVSSSARQKFTGTQLHYKNCPLRRVQDVKLRQFSWFHILIVSDDLVFVFLSYLSFFCLDRKIIAWN